MVENQARVGFGVLTGETKGLSEVSVGNRKLNGDWLHYGTKDWNEIIKQVDNLDYAQQHTGVQQYKPRFFKGEFSLNENPKDTLVDTTNWTKGIIWVNGKNLGKYWPTTGPQQTMYLPGVWLRKGSNTIILMEQEADNCIKQKCVISFTDVHVIDSDVPETV